MKEGKLQFISETPFCVICMISRQAESKYVGVASTYLLNNAFGAINYANM